MARRPESRSKQRRKHRGVQHSQGAENVAHPRLRGVRRPPARRRINGSSPRARGAGPPSVSASPSPRIIPACAGSRGRRPRQRQLTEDHPRVRGEQSASRARAIARTGSSPRARGAVLTGQTSPRPRDHPRVRGEQGSGPVEGKAGQGSSPRARGADRCVPVASRVALSGIIPACAGSRTATPACTATPRDHPRVRGEQADSPANAVDLEGSSPRARGAGPRSDRVRC